MDRLAFIGFGEAGQAFASDIRREALAGIAAFDIAGRQNDMVAAEVTPGSRAEALSGAAAVWCLVTADRAEVAAGDCAALLTPGAFWFDGNSCSPGAKRRSAAVIEAAGGRYVDVAIMAPVHPARASVPLLLAGPHAEAAAAWLAGIGMAGTVVGDAVGQASTIKMLRSVMIKGIEALTAESLLAARRAGVDGKVLASLQRSDPGFDWTARSAYNFERMAHHGKRRAAEMREVAKTVDELGLAGRMAAATALWQDQIAALAVDMGEGTDEAFGARADALLAALSK